MADEKTILDYLMDNVEKWGDRRWMTQPMGGGEGKLKFWTFKECIEEAKKMAGYIESLGLEPKSQIAICSKNCAWWVIADLAIWMSGHVSVPVYPTLTAETTKFILEHSESKLLFVGKLDEAPWKEMAPGVPEDLPTISFPLSPASSAKKTWDGCLKGQEPIKEPAKRVMDEMATIIYTSGSTGKPKGVMTSFRAMTVTVLGIKDIVKITEKDRYLSYLPISHGMERWLGECVPMVCGMQIFYAESLTSFVEDLNRCEPTLFMSVPRLWTKFQAGVHTKLPPQKLNFYLKIPILNIIVKKKILRTLGLSKVRFAGSGSAPLPSDVLQWYNDLGLVLLEGYGMTENFNYSHLSRPNKRRVGYVGIAYDDVECRIAEDGEIQVKTPGKMMGYYKNEEATKEAITEDGWVRTGDKGELDKDNLLKITGRTKEIFKTSKGKYVAPAPIENLLVGHPRIELACVGGRAQVAPHAIVQLTEDAKKQAANGKMAEIEAEIEEHLKVVNPQLDQHERLAFVAIVKDEWLPENGFLTPTQKIKRSTIEDNYANENDGWYAAKKKVIWHGF